MLNVGQLNEGFVLDHIEAGKAMDIYNNLGLGKLDCQVAIIKNARSSKMGRKDIIKIEGNTVFTYLDAFCTDEDFALFLPEYNNLDELKEHYKRGGLGDVKVKKSTGCETLYQGDQGWSGRNPSLFPMVGNTYTKDYEIDGKKYAMKNHGLIRYATLEGESKEAHDKMWLYIEVNAKEFMNECEPGVN